MEIILRFIYKILDDSKANVINQNIKRMISFVMSDSKFANMDLIHIKCNFFFVSYLV